MKTFPYNPMNYDYQTLKATLTARQELLNDILKKIEAQTTTPSLQHYLIVGPRGIGKTHLLRLIYFTIKEKKDSWFVLQFAEEEYGVINLAKFCQRIITEIANELTDFGEKPEPDYLAKILTELKEEEDDQVVVEKAISFLHQFTKDEKKRILLLVDNIDLILGSSFMDDLSLKRLRTFLMDDNTLLLIGASSTIFKEIIDYKQPLYNLFQRINLVELSKEDAIIFIRNWAESTGEDKITSNFGAYVPKINAIYHLTGGNPRLLLFLFRIFTAGELPEVHSAFESLLDEITPYFKAKMEALSTQQRTIMDALSKMDEAASPSLLASILKLKPNQVTAIIHTLVDNGYLKPIEKGKKRGTFYYDVTEQLFRIWYQVRSSTRQKKRFEWLLKFIELWYSLDELKEEQKKLTLKYTHLVDVGQVREAEMVRMHLDYVQAVVEVKKTKVQELFEKEYKMYNEGRYDEALICLDEVFAIDPQNAYAWWSKGTVLDSLGRHDEAIACFDEALKINPQYTHAWWSKGMILSNLDRHAEAITCFDEALKINPQDAYVWKNKGWVLGKLGRFEEAITCYDEALRINPQYAYAWYNKGVVLDNLGRYAEAITCFDEVLKMNPQDVYAWYIKGMVLGILGRHDEAITCFDEALKINPQDTYAWYSKGMVLGILGRHDEAITCFDETLKIDPQDAYAWCAKGVALNNLGRYDEAMVCFDNATKYALIRPKDLQGISKNTTRFYLEQIIWTILEENMGRVKDLLSKIIAFKQALEQHKVPEKETRFNQLMMDFFIRLLKKKKVEEVLELLEILDKSEISKYTAFLFPLKILAQYLKDKDEDTLNRQKPEVKGIIMEILQIFPDF